MVGADDARRHAWYWIFAPIVGLLFYFIYSRRAVVAGAAGDGAVLRDGGRADLPRVLSDLLAAGHGIVQAAAGDADTSPWSDVILHNWLFVIVLLTVMSYFFFSIRPESGVGKVQTQAASLGRWFLMIAFGAMFGNTVMARLSLFIGRVQFLLHEWLGPLLVPGIALPYLKLLTGTTARSTPHSPPTLLPV